MRCDAVLDRLGFLADARTRWYKRRGVPLVSVRAVLFVFDFTQGYISGKSFYKLAPRNSYGIFVPVLNKSLQPLYIRPSTPSTQ